jgi:putative heme-binding domain-containing protein
VRGSGGHIGPDLSNLIHRDVPSVVRDIEQPSFAINPEFLSYAITLIDGRVLSGSVRADGDMLYIGDKEGRETQVARDDIDEMVPLAISTMPEGLPKTLSPDAMKDLLAFLMLPGPEVFQPAEIETTGAPPPRTWKEVREVLGDDFGKTASDGVPASGEPLNSDDLSSADEAEPRPLHIVLVAGPKDHGPGEHDYPLWLRRWSQLLALAQNVRVTTADRWPSDDDLASADVLVLYSANPDFSPEKAAQIEAYQKRGGGLVLLHYAVNGQRAPDRWADHIGLAWQDGRSRFRHGELVLNFDSADDHPIARGFGPTRFVDESYWELLGDPDSIHVLAAGEEEGKPRPLLWTYQHEKGRVFVSILGHYSWTFDDPLFRILILRGICWTAGQPVDRLSELATIGARIAGDEKSAAE